MDCGTTGESPGERGCILQPDKKDPWKGKIKTNSEALGPLCTVTKDSSLCTSGDLICRQPDLREGSGSLMCP